MPWTEQAQIDIRAVHDTQELLAAFARIAPLFLTSVDPTHDFRLERLLDHFDADRELMLIAVDVDGDIQGAALGYRSKPGAVKLQALAVDIPLQRHGIGTQLVRALEQRARQLGSNSIYLGAEEPARPFYAALGYHGRHSVLSKSLAGGALAIPTQMRRERLAALKQARTERLLDTTARDEMP